MERVPNREDDYGRVRPILDEPVSGVRLLDPESEIFVVVVDHDHDRHIRCSAAEPSERLHPRRVRKIQVDQDDVDIAGLQAKEGGVQGRAGFDVELSNRGGAHQAVLREFAFPDGIVRRRNRDPLPSVGRQGAANISNQDPRRQNPVPKSLIGADGTETARRPPRRSAPAATGGAPQARPES
jgi:hypothetical protein